MSTRYESLLSPEQEYEAAGWVCVAETLKDLGERRKRDELSDTTKKWVGAYGFLLASVYSHNAASLIVELESQANSSIRHIPTMLTNSKMLAPDGSVDPNLRLAHDLSFVRDPSPKRQIARTRFARLEPLIDDMRDYNRSVLANVRVRPYDYTIGHALNEIRRESAFFVGYYDNES